jgi:DNA segregation ATPase FtsK/SpoIIIE-like protein
MDAKQIFDQWMKLKERARVMFDIYLQDEDNIQYVSPNRIEIDVFNEDEAEIRIELGVYDSYVYSLNIPTKWLTQEDLTEITVSLLERHKKEKIEREKQREEEHQRTIKRYEELVSVFEHGNHEMTEGSKKYRLLKAEYQRLQEYTSRYGASSSPLKLRNI